MRNGKGFDARLNNVTKRHHGARALFDSALDELESAAAEFDALEAEIEERRLVLLEQSRAAAAGSAQATRVAAKIRELIS